MILKHISHDFFYLTEHQARQLSIDGKLPRDGYQKKADLGKLETVQLLYRDYRLHQWFPGPVAARNAKRAWIMPTPLSHWDGELLNSGWVWSLFLLFAAPYPWEPLGADALRAMVERQNKIAFAQSYVV